MNLPKPNYPFLPASFHRIRADLYKFPPDATHFVADDQLFYYVQQKLENLQQRPSHYRHLDERYEAESSTVFGRVAALYASEYPEILTIEDERLHLKLFGIWCSLHEVSGGTDALGRAIAQHLRSITGMTRLWDALALTCQEDIVVMHEEDFAEVMHVCLPSKWDIRDKIGLGFSAIHDPVGDGARLRAASDNVMQAIVYKAPFVRYGWGLTLDATLDHHLDVPTFKGESAWFDDPQTLAENTYLRMERQTTYPMPDLGRALFTIRVTVQPLLDAADTPQKRQQVHSVLATMHPDVLRYKGLDRLQAPLMQWCEDINT